MARTRSRRRTRRTRRARYGLFDRLLIAGIVGGSVYLILHGVLTVPPAFAAVLGFIAFGFTVGASVRTPRWRSPIVWRRR